jgi:CHAT domain-containing protein
LFRGNHADIEEVRKMTPLPETADELCQVGKQFGAGEQEILLGGRATESAIKDLSAKGKLSDFRIIHFATHGLLAGQVEGAAEPGLILTPPLGTTEASALDYDDGFLTASEIATLKLDADWVVLSACNTAGGQLAWWSDAVSGVARGFLFAGARSLLVSHWEVNSLATVKLITRTFAALKAKPSTRRADALRLSMQHLVTKGTLAEAHPSYWAPFVLVGEGGNRR